MRGKHASAPAVPDDWNIFGYDATQYGRVPCGFCITAGEPGETLTRFCNWQTARSNANANPDTKSVEVVSDQGF
jgi:hypothetical protein